MVLCDYGRKPFSQARGSETSLVFKKDFTGFHSTLFRLTGQALQLDFSHFRWADEMHDPGQAT